MRRLVFFLLTSLGISFSVMAQHIRIEYTYKEESKRNSILTEIIFRDTLANKVVNKIDVLAMNPFSNLNYPVNEKISEREGHKVYDLRGRTLKEIVPERILKNYHFTDASKIYPTVGQYFVDNRQYPDMAMLKFTFSIGDDSTMFVSYSDLYVFKSDGTELFALKNNPINVIDANIDPQAQYLYYTYGVRIGIVPVLDGGLKIVNLKEKQVSMEFPGDEITIRFLNDNMLYFFYNGIVREDRPDRWLKVLDFKSMSMLTHRYTFKEMLQLRAITPTGVIYKSDSTTIEPFLLKFSYEKLAWKSYLHTGNYIDYEFHDNIADGNHIKAIVFKSPDADKILRTLNIKEFNPFKSLPYIVTDSTEPNIRFFDLKQASPKDALPANVYKAYSSLFNKNSSLQTARTSVDCVGDKNHALLTYTFSVGTPTTRAATYTKLYVFNEDGTEAFRQEDSDAYIWQTAVDESGHYLCYRYAVGNNDTILKTGYRIWDISGKIRYFVEFQLDKATYQFIAPGVICFFGSEILKDNTPGAFLFVVDLVNKMTYRKSYKKDDMLDITLINADGIEFKNNKTENFKKDFEGEGLSWKKWDGNGK